MRVCHLPESAELTYVKFTMVCFVCGTNRSKIRLSETSFCRISKKYPWSISAKSGSFDKLRMRPAFGQEVLKNKDLEPGFDWHQNENRL